MNAVFSLLVLIYCIVNFSDVTGDGAHKKGAACLNNIISNLKSLPTQRIDGSFPYISDPQHQLVVPNNLNIYGIFDYMIDNFTLFFEGNCDPNNITLCSYEGYDYRTSYRREKDPDIVNISLYTFIDYTVVFIYYTAFSVCFAYYFLATR
ncbi:uncharacterized protein LOC142353337 [Convolutriloba macropyga]|uniref:uncharacterized protein LOC142353337 n=1 Tax=Convolutriloba macropyga TaxID=536237 RepID=UPI003F52868C